MPWGLVDGRPDPMCERCEPERTLSGTVHGTTKRTPLQCYAAWVSRSSRSDNPPGPAQPREIDETKVAPSAVISVMSPFTNTGIGPAVAVPVAPEALSRISAFRLA